MTLIRPVIIAGGPGARLWPLSDASRPKPFLRLDGKQSLLDQTLDRFRDPVLFAEPVIACAAAHAGPARDAMAAAGVASPSLILEPEPRDTAAAIAAVVAARIADGGADEIVLVAPADHVIADPVSFRAGCAKGLAPARDGRLVLFGATPTEPHTGFGYIEAAGTEAVADIASFREKPDRAVAERYLAGGRHLWNMGLFMARASVFEALFLEHAPEIYAIAKTAVEEGRRNGGALALAPKIFASAPKAAFDRAVVEKTRGGAMVRLSVGWSDVGAWDAVYDALPRDGQGNATVGAARLLGAKNTLVHAHGLKVSAIGVEGLAIVAVGDHILVCPLDQAQRVKELQSVPMPDPT